MERYHATMVQSSRSGGRMLVASTSVLASTALLLPLALRERRHRGPARLRIAVRGACDFSWMANADHGKAACATLLPKPALPKSVSHKASAVANRLLSRGEDVVADNSVAA